MTSAGEAGRDGEGKASGEGSARSASETHAKHVGDFKRSYRSVRRRLSVLCTSMVRSVLGGRYMASYHIKSTRIQLLRGARVVGHLFPDVPPRNQVREGDG